jgi:hypothetical protein
MKSSELYLRNLNNCFYKLDKNRKYSVYHDPINNNIILFSPMDDCTIESVCNATVSPGAYEYLINLLNTENNIIVFWSQIDGTTSDYSIYFGYDINTLKDLSYKEILNMLPENDICYKFLLYKYGGYTKIEF